MLELREELQRAESDLASLKKQWALYEANKKKNEIRHAEKLQPFTAPKAPKADSDTENSAAVKRASFERTTNKPKRRSQQRLFSGSRQTRTLSLLSPTKPTKPSFPQPSDARNSVDSKATATEKHGFSLSRSSTLSNVQENLTSGRTYKNLAGRKAMQAPAREVLLQTGKQVASELREGLWTFFEDMRQVTVGEEAISGPNPRPASLRTGFETSARNVQDKKLRAKEMSESKPRKTPRRRSEQPTNNANKDTKSRIEQQKDSSFWKEFGVDTPAELSTANDTNANEHRTNVKNSIILSDTDDNWEWESPKSHRGPSSTESRDRPRTPKSDEALPWPEIKKLTPSKLTRTVSDLMKDWDTPAPEPDQRPPASELLQHLAHSSEGVL